ncbi:hypothetical protein [Halobellus captivus]|uniref:hypothetical protein n=1 Tax=Halobellus captivus TaxID=2592614 RepID=UPI001EEFA38A|nr:hypothetical protein [Halobellus captivus]
MTEQDADTEQDVSPPAEIERDANPDTETAQDARSAAELPGTDDLRVAAVAAACTVGLTLLLQYGAGREVPLLWRLLPLAPYFLSLFTKRVDLGGFDTPRNWSLLTIGVTLATFLYFGVVA